MFALLPCVQLCPVRPATSLHGRALQGKTAPPACSASRRQTGAAEEENSQFRKNMKAFRFNLQPQGGTGSLVK